MWSTRIENPNTLVIVQNNPAWRRLRRTFCFSPIEGDKTKCVNLHAHDPFWIKALFNRVLRISSVYSTSVLVKIMKKCPSPGEIQWYWATIVSWLVNETVIMHDQYNRTYFMDYYPQNHTSFNGYFTLNVKCDLLKNSSEGDIQPVCLLLSWF